MQGRLTLRDRPIVPALLALPGIALPLFYLSQFVDLLLYPQPLPVGGEGPGIGILILLIPFLIGAAVLLALIPIIFTTFLLRQPAQHRTWGMALTVWWSLESIYLGVGVVSSLSAASALYGSPSQISLSWWTTEYAAPLFGLVGGIWAVVWHNRSSKTDFAKRIVGPAGRVLIGGLVIFFSIGALPLFAIFFVPAIGLLLCAILLFFAPQTGRAIGVVVIVVCAFVGFLLPGQIQDLGGYPVNAYYGFGAAITALVAGAVVAGSGAVGALRQRRTLGEKERPQKGSTNRMWDLPSSGS